MTTLIHGAGQDEDAIIAEAYSHVLEGYRRALTTSGLPERETEDLRSCYRAAAELARKPIVTARGGDA